MFFVSWCLGSLVFLQYFLCVLVLGVLGRLSFYNTFGTFWFWVSWVACLFTILLVCFGVSWVACLFTILLVCSGFWVSWVACLLTTLVIFVRLKCLIEESLRPDSSGGFDVSLVSFSSVL